MVPVSARKPPAEQTSMKLRREYKVVRSSLTLKMFYKTARQAIGLETCAKPHRKTSGPMSLNRRPVKGRVHRKCQDSMRSSRPLQTNEPPPRYALQEVPKPALVAAHRSRRFARRAATVPARSWPKLRCSHHLKIKKIYYRLKYWSSIEVRGKASMSGKRRCLSFCNISEVSVVAARSAY